MKIPASTVARANLNHWRAGQGARIKANRPHEVFRACEFIAQLVAPVRDPLILDQAEINIAIKRAVSPERNKRHQNSPPPKSADDWWSQVEEIGRQWGLTLKREEWTTTLPERDRQPPPSEAKRSEFKPGNSPTDQRMAELARAHRTGEPPPDHRDIPEVA